MRRPVVASLLALGLLLAAAAPASAELVMSARYADSNEPSALAPDGPGAFLLARKHRIVRVTSDGAVTPIAGTGTYGSSGDGGPALTAQLRDPQGVARLAGGDIVLAEFFTGALRR